MNKIKYNSRAYWNGLKSNVRVNTDSKSLAVGLAVVALPLLTVMTFFFTDLNVGNLLSAINFSEKNSVENFVEEEKATTSELKLVSRDQFLEKYNPAPAFLPKDIKSSASLSAYLRSNSAGALLPARNWSVEHEDINATVAYAAQMPSGRVLYGKNVNEVRPIASLSKLMTALVAVESFDLEEPITISQHAVSTEGNSASLVVGEKLTVHQLLYALLLESSNDAAVALEEHYNDTREEGNFVARMNTRASEMGLTHTNFEEPSGLSENNISTAQEVAKLLYAAAQNETVAQIIASANHTASSENREITHYWINLNTLLGADETILGGKTGYTDEAGPSMALITTTPNKGDNLVTVVLNAQDRVKASRDLINWVRTAYIWQE